MITPRRPPSTPSSLGLRRTALAIGLCVGALSLSSHDQCREAGQGSLARSSADDGLVGLWGTEQMFGPLARGQLSLDGRSALWRAQIAGFDVPVQHDMNAITFQLPGEAGTFRGHTSNASPAVIGNWIQPKGVAGYSRMATPVLLSQIHPGVWRGAIAPLDDRISFYISIQRKEDGSLTAFIRNPEFNYFRRRTYRVELHGSAVTLVDAQNPSEAIQGTYEAATGQLSVPALESHPPLVFTRRRDRDAVGFFPRPTLERYVYRAPIAEDDGWNTASLAGVGLNERPLSALIEKILTASPADNPVNIQSVLIARHGKLVLEEYFYGFDQERTHDMRSASKTFGPVLVGIAADRGVAIGPFSPVLSLFPEYGALANPDERKGTITLKDVMSMTSGLTCNDYDDASPGNEDRMQSQDAQPDWYKFALDLPMARDPGADGAQYCSAGMNLTGGMVRNATGKSLPDVFYEYLASPLQFRSYHLNLTPTGDVYMGGGFSLRPRDELKLGQLYLANGLWNGHRVVSKGWVEQSTQRHSTLGKVIDDFVDDYGYGWHVFHVTVSGHVYRGYSAGGNGGQFIIVIPELDLVVGFNGGSYGDFPAWLRWSVELVPQYIIPAALSGEGR